MKQLKITLNYLNKKFITLKCRLGIHRELVYNPLTDKVRCRNKWQSICKDCLNVYLIEWNNPNYYLKDTKTFQKQISEVEFLIHQINFPEWKV